jgi:hypothetical protein
MVRARRTGDRVVALDAVIRLLAHITRRAYSQLVAAVRLLAPSGRWYVDTSLSFVHDRRDVPDYLARVLYSALVVRDLVRDGGVTLADLFTDEKYASHKDALAMGVTFDGKAVDVVVYDRFKTQDGDAVVVVVPRGNAGQHFALTGARTYGDVWLSARGYELTKGRVTSDVTYMNMVLGEVHDIHPLPTHETHYVLVMRERTRRSEGRRGYEYTVPVRVGRLHDMQSDGVPGIIARNRMPDDEHGRTHVVAAPGAFALLEGKAESDDTKTTQQGVAVVVLLLMQQQQQRLWMLIDVVLIWKRFFMLRPKRGGSDISTRIGELREAQRPLHEAAGLLVRYSAATFNESLRVDPSGTGAVSPVAPFSTEPVWSVSVIAGEVYKTLNEAALTKKYETDDTKIVSFDEANKLAESLSAQIKRVYARLLAIETEVADADAGAINSTDFGQPERTFALCDGVLCRVDTTSEMNALTALDSGRAEVNAKSHCVYFDGEMRPRGWLQQQQPSGGVSDDDSSMDVSVLSTRVRDKTAVCAVLRVRDAMDLVEKTKIYVSVMDRPLVRLSTGAASRVPLVTYLCAYTNSNLTAWYRRYRDSRYQDTSVLNSIPAALVVVDEGLAAALDHMQAAKFSCGPGVARALIADLCGGTPSRDRVLLCVALAYQRSEFSMAPYIKLKHTSQAVNIAEEAHKQYAARVAYARALALPQDATDETDDLTDLTEPRWNWLDVDGDTDAMRERQRAFRRELVEYTNKQGGKATWRELIARLAGSLVQNLNEASASEGR